MGYNLPVHLNWGLHSLQKWSARRGRGCDGVALGAADGHFGGLVSDGDHYGAAHLPVWGDGLGD